MVIKATSSSREEGTSHILTHDGSQLMMMIMQGWT
jgi:hypothetical protein